ncbi:hypothetical protein N7456_000436 [Penicillium angulare]|uniref:Uncharacterized protein n=1 Tax=Penicillium angulare TaxID=116970 RepID=A0A9W9KRW8_9EURO|nr:hypothetical protein N7456_000436 [Penicillium angulare]
MASPNPRQPGSSPSFALQESIVLLGAQRTGKHTLASIASVATGTEILDFEEYFYERNDDHSMNSFARMFGADALKSRQNALMDGMFSSYPQGHIIVCDIAHIDLSNEGSLKAFAEKHTVINILSDIPFSKGNPAEKMSQNAILGSRLSNYEYTNIYEELEDNANGPSLYNNGPPLIAMQRTKLAFLRFLKGVINDESSIVEIDDPRLSPISRMPFTYALTLSLTEMKSINSVEFLLQDGADALELCVDFHRDLTACPTAIQDRFKISHGLTLARFFFLGSHYPESTATGGET